MQAALAYVAAHPGCSKSDAVRDLGGIPLRLTPVDRLIRLGWVRAEAVAPGKGYQLYVTEQGREAGAR
jgi:hypothetical protein